MVGHWRGSLAKALTIALPVIPGATLGKIFRTCDEKNCTGGTSDNASRHFEGLKYWFGEKYRELEEAAWKVTEPLCQCLR